MSLGFRWFWRARGVSGLGRDVGAGGCGSHPSRKGQGSDGAPSVEVEGVEVGGGHSCLRAALSGNGLRQSGIVFFFSFRNAALEAPLFHGAATVCGETDCRNSRFLTGPLARFGMTSVMAAIGARWRSPKALPPYGKWKCG